MRDWIPSLTYIISKVFLGLYNRSCVLEILNQLACMPSPENNDLKIIFFLSEVLRMSHPNRHIIYFQGLSKQTVK
jgi:hypothetical protein